MKEIEISRIIIEQYHSKLLDCLDNDVVEVGAGPAGLTAGYYLAKKGVKTTVLEKRLSTGGGIWGGAAGNSVIIVEDKDISQRNKMRNFAMKLSKITFRPFVKGTILQKPLIMSLIFVPLLWSSKPTKRKDNT